MEDSLERKLFFIDSIQDYDITSLSDCVLHILCMEGSMSFSFQGVHYNVVAGDYVILPNLLFLSGLTQSDDFDAQMMGLSSVFVNTLGIRSNYGIIGQLLLMQNPVMKLSRHDFMICLEDLMRIRARLMETAHLFREEMMGHLLLVHILNLYDIHARGKAFTQLSERLSTS